ncbi:Uncharacterized protein dnm_073010 [Desulfonema magnum]|uniref:Uncharacterized protein n=1 Tax=Desulfonema magnum TaxID=45655 RepID=A0A975BTL0_9BACT|nr:Uncharacterized protein dnm_073010 [Desulfonema magnum]
MFFPVLRTVSERKIRILPGEIRRIFLLSANSLCLGCECHVPVSLFFNIRLIKYNIYNTGLSLSHPKTLSDRKEKT